MGVVDLDGGANMVSTATAKAFLSFAAGQGNTGV